MKCPHPVRVRLDPRLRGDDVVVVCGDDVVVNHGCAVRWFAGVALW